MDKLIQFAVEIRLNDTKISQIEKRCYNGEITSGEALDLVIEQCKESDKRIKAILNEPVKVSKKQFMLEQTMHGMSIN